MRDERAFLWDMLDSARRCLRYVGGKKFDQFLNDEELQDAVIRRLSIIGEAAKSISPETRSLLPELPFEEMCGMRDIVVHTYWNVNLEIVWSTATIDLPTLIKALVPLIPPDEQPRSTT